MCEVGCERLDNCGRPVSGVAYGQRLADGDLHRQADAFETVTLKFEGVAANPQLTIETSTKRAFVDNIYVYAPTSTGVEMPVVQVSTHETYYTLSGQRLAKRPTQPGIYIISGKKVVVK